MFQVSCVTLSAIVYLLLNDFSKKIICVCVCEPEENQSVLSRLYRMSQHGVYSAVKVDWVFSALSPRWAGLWLPRLNKI